MKSHLIDITLQQKFFFERIYFFRERINPSSPNALYALIHLNSCELEPSSYFFERYCAPPLPSKKQQTKKTVT